MSLSQGKARIVQTAMTGTLLSNLLSVLGTCFFLGAWDKQDKLYPLIVLAQAHSHMLFSVLASLATPAVYIAWSQSEFFFLRRHCRR